MTEPQDKTAQGVYVTQEDIDRVMTGASPPISEAVEADTETLTLDASDIVAVNAQNDGEEDLEYFGLLSKDDIEALLHGDLLASGGKDAQEEIDLLFGETEGRTTAVSQEAAAPSGKGDEQADVDRLLAEEKANEAKKKEDAGLVSQGDSEQFIGDEAAAPESAVSQDDIDALLKGAVTEEEAVAAEAPAADGGVSQDDIDALLKGAVAEEEAVVAEAPAADGGVSQDDIDALLKGAVAEEEAVAAEAPAADGGVSQDDIDALLKGAVAEEEAVVAEAPAADQDGKPENLISQDDINQLLQEAAAPPEAAPGARAPSDAEAAHISQDDINKLLQESLAEEDDATDTKDEEAPPEPVILAAVEEAAPTPAPPSEAVPVSAASARAFRRWFRSPKQAVAMAAGLVLAVSLAVWLGSRTTEDNPSGVQVLSFPIQAPDAGQRFDPVPGGRDLFFKGFLVLAPVTRTGFAYVRADLHLVLAEASFSAVIKENEAFVRDVIYGTIDAAVRTREVSAINAITLELDVRKALGRIVPREAIVGVDFSHFEMV